MTSTRSGAPLPKSHRSGCDARHPDRPHAGVPSPLGRLVIIAIASLVGSLLAVTPASGQAESDFRWVPPTASELRSLADAISDARARDDRRRTLETIERYAVTLTAAVPEGGFPLAPGRWLGSAHYLSETLGLLDPRTQRDAVEAIDLELRGRLEADEAGRLRSRVHRDFPYSRYADDYIDERITLLVEAGHIDSALELTRDRLSAEERAAIATLARTPESPDGSIPIDAPLLRTFERDWGAPPRIGETASNRWAYAPYRSKPLITHDGVFLLGPDELLGLDPKRGRVTWSVPFYAHPAAPIPGSILRPSAWGDHIVGVTATHRLSVSRTAGAPNWLEPIAMLFEDPAPTDPAIDSEKPGEDPNDVVTDERPLVLSASATVAGRGLVIAAFQLRNDYVRGRIALIGRDGEVIWNRSLGSAPGGTYLGLGHAHPALAVHGQHAFVLTQRGFLIAVDLHDGALDWAIEYPSHGPRGSRDALGYRTHYRAADLHAFRGSDDETWILGAPIDASQFFIWNQDGRVIASIPQGEARWWEFEPTGPDSGELALVAPRSLTLWRVGRGRVELAHEFELPENAPSFCGAPDRGERDWWAPHAFGYHRFVPDDAGSFSWRFGWLDLDFDVANVHPIGDRLLALGGGRLALFRPASPSEWAGASEREGILKARHLLRAGRTDALIEQLKTLVANRSGRALDAPTIDARIALGSELVETLFPGLGTHPDSSITVTDEQRRELFGGALALLPAGFLSAQAAFDEAVDSARAGAIPQALSLAYRAIEDSAYATVQLSGYLEAPVELAVRRLLDRLAERGPLDLIEFEARAASELESAGRASDPERLAGIVRRFPRTEAGRKAAIQLAEYYYRAQNRTQTYFVLSRLVLLEPDSPEGVRARFELAALHSEMSRYGAARRQLEILRDGYGDLSLTSKSGAETVRERVERLLRQLPAARDDEPRLGLDRVVDLRPVWRDRSDLLIQRGLEIVTYEEEPALEEGHFLAVSSRSVSLSDARDGHTHWTATLPSPDGARSLLPRTAGFLEKPLAVTSDRIVMTDGRILFALDPRDGSTHWATDPGNRADIGLSEVETRLTRTAADDRLVVALGDDERVRAYDAKTGDALWTTRAPGPASGPPSMSTSGIVFSYIAAGRLEVLDRTTGEPRTVIDVNAAKLDAGRLMHAAAWFASPTEIVVPLERGVGIYDLDQRRFVWTEVFTSLLDSVHRIPGLPFVVFEIDALSQGRVLVGVSLDRRRILWKKPMRTGTIKSIRRIDDGLYVLTGTYGLSSRVIRLELPSAFLSEDEIDLLPPTVLETDWNTPLGRTYDHYSICDYGNWILVWGSLRSTVVILDKETGRTADEGPFGRVESHLQNRVSLLFADFIGETLVVLTRRGGFGFRPLSDYELTAKTWESLQAIDPLADDPNREPVAALEASSDAYQRGQIESACRILESVLAEPGLPGRVIRPLLRRLEAFAQERGERDPLAWTLPRLPRPPVVDGILDEPWGAQFAFPLESARYFHPMQGPDENGAAWRGWRDQSALLFAGWSERGFHLAIDVTDDSVHPYDRDQDRWTGDCLLLALDLRDNGGLSPGRDDQLLTLALTVPKPAPPPPPMPAGEDGEPPPRPGEDEENKPEGEYQVLRKADGSGVVYEIMIPWETFREARDEENLPYPGISFRMNVIVTDDDSGNGAASYMGLSVGQMIQQSSSAAFDFFSPEFFARLTLGR